MTGSMSWTRHRYGIAAAVPVVAVFAALYLWMVPTDGPEWTAAAFGLAVLFAIPTFLWLVTSLLLVDRWWNSAGARLSTMDVPGQMLTATVATLPEPRQRWGEAMLGELTQVQGRWPRWRFALSCTRATLSLWLPTGRPVLAIAAGVVVAATTAAHTVVGAAVPGLGFFATCFVALVGAMVVLGIARAGRVRVTVAALLVTIAVVASVVATATFLLQHPTAADGLQSASAAILAASLACCLWLAVAPPRRLDTTSRVAPNVGLAAAAIFVLGGLAISRADVEGLPAYWLLFGPVLTFMVAASIAAAVGRSFRIGLQAGIWTVITVMPLSWSVGLATMLHQYGIDGRWTFAGDTSSAGFNLGFAFMTFLAVPIIGFPFAVFGALTGAAIRGTRRNGVHTGATPPDTPPGSGDR